MFLDEMSKMVSLVWFVLSLFNICDFSWWSVFIKGIVFCLILFISSADVAQKGALGQFLLGLVIFAGLRLFCGLTISPWWMLLAGIWFILAAIIPGGFSLTYLLFNYLSVITHSKSFLIFLMIVDTIIFVLMVCGLLKERFAKE